MPGGASKPKRHFSECLLALPTDVQTRIFLYLSPDDLGVLSRCVIELAGIEEDRFLRRVWIKQTAPSRIDFKLFSPHHPRPDANELVRRGTLRGIAIVSGVKAHTYWASESAVRLSRTHANLQLALVRRALTIALAPSHRPSAPALHALGILPAPSTRASASIAAAAHTLQRQLERDHVRRSLLVARVGRSLGEVMQAHAGLWREGEAVRTALCPSIRGRRRFFEGLATATATAAGAATTDLDQR